ncbi:hypothetical protein ACFSSA_00850 [Luteolibacter algae]|uniref:Uncharacterized protein n=1 Tax=Luteolibacter algae TaxID=454151 RepID=A0ABW5D3W2_9BACT
MSEERANKNEINPAIKRDLESALRQQMFYWGMDASFWSGNLFLEKGFSKSPSRGLQGTSCYSLPWKDGSIELHGACAGWYNADGNDGFIYIRTYERCFHWHGNNLPVPGDWEADSLSPLDLEKSMNLLSPFLEWWLDFESFVHNRTERTYRKKCFKKYKSLPKARPWLKPHAGMAWLQSLLNDPLSVSRAKKFNRTLVG